MLARIRLLALVLAVPAVGFAVGQLAPRSLDTALRTELRSQYRAAPTEQFDRVSAAQLCHQSDAAGSDLCALLFSFRWLRVTSIGTAVVGLLLLVAIAAAGVAARADRRRLLTLFGPGMRLTAAIVAILIVAHATIAIGVLYLGGSAFGGRVPAGIILVIALGAVAGVIAVVRSAFSLVQRARTSVIGASITRTDAPHLWNHVDGVARRLGSLQPEYIVVGLDPNFFFTEADVAIPGGVVSGRTLYCSMPLARVLTVGEFTAIVGHELGHFRGEDTAFSHRFYPIYRGTIAALARLGPTVRGFRTIAILPAIAVLSFFLERFALAVNEDSRSRELLADRAGAEAASARTMATALVKVHAFSGAWAEVLEQAVGRFAQAGLEPNLSSAFVTRLQSVATPAAFDGIADSHMSHPTDSHPSLALRLQSLEIDLSMVSTDALVVQPPDAAIELVQNADALEVQLSHLYQRLLAAQLGINLPQSVVERGGAASGQRTSSSPIRLCSACHTRVLPTAAQRCPSCGAPMPA